EILPFLEAGRLAPQRHGEDFGARGPRSFGKDRGRWILRRAEHEPRTQFRAIEGEVGGGHERAFASLRAKRSNPGERRAPHDSWIAASLRSSRRPSKRAALWFPFRFFGIDGQSARALH